MALVQDMTLTALWATFKYWIVSTLSNPWLNFVVGLGFTFRGVGRVNKLYYTQLGLCKIIFWQRRGERSHPYLVPTPTLKNQQNRRRNRTSTYFTYIEGIQNSCSRISHFGNLHVKNKSRNNKQTEITERVWYFIISFLYKHILRMYYTGPQKMIYEE